MGSIDLALRPIKFAFLVNPNEKKSILEAININSFLWGGIYNPIIPVYKKTPITLNISKVPKIKYSDIVNGYIDTFDPDFVVKIGNVNLTNINIGFRKLLSIQEILGSDFETKLRLEYGLGIPEISNQYFKDELKYVLQFPIKFLSFNFKGKSNLFLQSVFGSLQAKINEKYLKYYSEALKIEPRDCTINDLGEFLKGNYLFYRRLTQKYIKSVWTRDAYRNDCVFIMNSESSLDILDYWNLRAIGWSILPFPLQSTNDKALIDNVKNFVEENFFPTQEVPQVIYNTTTFLKSRTINDDKFNTTLNLISSINENHYNKTSVQNWYPRIWDKWAREKDNVEYCQIEGRKKTITLSNVDDINFNIIKPKFAKRFYQIGPKFANEIKIHTYSDEKELYARVIPEGDHNLIRALNTYGYSEWRFSRNGIVYLSNHDERNIKFTLPHAEKVFLEWLKNKNFDAKISDNGRIVYQIIKYIGGVQNLQIIANKSVIDLLIEMREGKTKSNKELLQALSDNNMDVRFQIIESLNKLNILQCGFEIKCPICSQFSWYTLTKLDYKLNCTKCFNDFAFHIKSQGDINLSYRTLGPFIFSKSSYGVLSELLTLRFFSSVMHNPVTILSGFKLTPKIEVDLGVLFQSSYIGDSKMKILFCECKTNNEFMKKDIERMKKISISFPGAIMVFATLNNELTENEKKLILPLISKERSNRKKSNPYNQILILTRVELLSSKEPPYCWRNLEGIYKNYYSGNRTVHDIGGLCEATQEIYLGVKPSEKILMFSSDKGMVQIIS